MFKTLSILNKENPYLIGKEFIEKEELYKILEEELLQNESAFLIHLKNRLEKKN